jgi:hypothetical protein
MYNFEDTSNTRVFAPFFEKKESKKFGRIKKSNNAAIRSRI